MAVAVHDWGGFFPPHIIKENNEFERRTSNE